RELTAAGADVRDAVAAIVAGVRAHGDAALDRYVERFDATGGAPLRVSPSELDAAAAALRSDVRAGLEVAMANVAAVAGASLGGAHAVAALAYGTARVARVDVIAGPGNLYVQEAKRLVSGDVGIDGFLGPSDVLVLAAPGADPELVALDLLAQAEHGEGTIVA